MDSKSLTSQSEDAKVKTRKNLFVTSISFTLCYAAYQGVIGIESSINVEEGLGTTSVLVIFIISSMSSITLVPNLIDFYGAKTAIIIGEIGFAAYIAANFYPSWYTLMPAAVFHGLIESAPWAGSSVYVSYMGQEKWKKQDTHSSMAKKQKSFVYNYFGIFYSFVFAGNVLGNGITSIILRVFKDKEVALNSGDFTAFNDSTTTTSFLLNSSTESHHISFANRLKKCGAKDCQAEYIYDGTEEELETFNTSLSSIYVLLGVFMAMSALGIILQVIFADRAPAKFDKPNTPDTEAKLRDDEDQQQVQDKYQPLKNLRCQLRDTFFHIVSLQHLLVAPMFFYFGLEYAYVITEYTRAYVSCTLGVAELGLALMVFSVSGASVSVLGTRLVLLVGRKRYVFILGIFHSGIYMISLFWIPTETNLWMVYVIGILCGIGEGLIVSFTQGIIAVYFEKNKLGIAYSVTNLVTNLGIVAATAWSTSLCVYVKIYIQMGFLVFAVFSLIGAEILYSRNQAKRERQLGSNSVSQDDVASNSLLNETYA